MLNHAQMSEGTNQPNKEEGGRATSIANPVVGGGKEVGKSTDGQSSPTVFSNVDSPANSSMFFAEVKMFSGKFHIFKKGVDRCLCGRYGLPFDLKEDDKVAVTGKENFRKGSDCKSCFKKAKLNIEEKNNAR